VNFRQKQHTIDNACKKCGKQLDRDGKGPSTFDAKPTDNPISEY